MYAVTSFWKHFYLNNEINNQTMESTAGAQISKQRKGVRGEGWKARGEGGSQVKGRHYVPTTVIIADTKAFHSLRSFQSVLSSILLHPALLSASASLWARNKYFAAKSLLVLAELYKVETNVGDTFIFERIMLRSFSFELNFKLD